MRVAAKAADFEIAKPGVDRIAQRRRWLRRTLKTKHAFVPRLDGEPVGFLACFRRPLCRCPDRRTVNGKWSRVICCPCKRGCAGPRWTGKPLQIAMDSVPGTTRRPRGYTMSLLRMEAPNVRQWPSSLGA